MPSSSTCPLHSLFPSSLAPQSLCALLPLLPEGIHSLPNPGKFCTQLCHLLKLPTCILHDFLVKFPEQVIHTSLLQLFYSNFHTLILLNDSLGPFYFLYSLTSYKPLAWESPVPLTGLLPLSPSFLLANCSGMKPVTLSRWLFCLSNNNVHFFSLYIFAFTVSPTKYAFPTPLRLSRSHQAL